MWKALVALTGSLCLLGGCAARRTDLFYRHRVASPRADDLLIPPARYAHDFTGRVPAELLKDFGAFRRSLAHCGEDELARAVAERLALPSQTVLHLRYGSFAHVGFVDFDAGFRLRVVTPLRGPIEFAAYEIRPQGGRLRLELTGVEVRNRDEARRDERPRDGFLANLSAVRLRLFLLTRVSNSDHDVAILAAASAQAMERATEAFEARPEDCALMAGCVPVPKGVAITPEIRVHAQGRPVFVPLGGTVRSALQAAGEKTPAAVADRLMVLRPFDGRKILVRPEGVPGGILNLALVGGEELTW